MLSKIFHLKRKDCKNFHKLPSVSVPLSHWLRNLIHSDMSVYSFHAMTWRFYSTFDALISLRLNERIFFFIHWFLFFGSNGLWKLFRVELPHGNASFISLAFVNYNLFLLPSIILRWMSNIVTCTQFFFKAHCVCVPFKKFINRK